MMAPSKPAFNENDAYGNDPAEIPPSYTPAPPTLDDIESLRRNMNKILARVIILEDKIK